MCYFVVIFFFAIIHRLSRLIILFLTLISLFRKSISFKKRNQGQTVVTYREKLSKGLLRQNFFAFSPCCIGNNFVPLQHVRGEIRANKEESH